MGARATVESAGTGMDLLALVADVSRAADVRGALDAVATRWGRVDTLCDCAGIFWAQRGVA